MISKNIWHISSLLGVSSTPPFKVWSMTAIPIKRNIDVPLARVKVKRLMIRTRIFHDSQRIAMKDLWIVFISLQKFGSTGYGSFRGPPCETYCLDTKWSLLPFKNFSYQQWIRIVGSFFSFAEQAIIKGIFLLSDLHATVPGSEVTKGFFCDHGCRFDAPSKSWKWPREAEDHGGKLRRKKGSPESPLWVMCETNFQVEP